MNVKIRNEIHVIARKMELSNRAVSSIVYSGY